MSPRSIAIVAALACLSTVFLTGCGTSSGGLTGSKRQTATGVGETGYPGGQPRDTTSPALASSSEQIHSDAGKPKVPKDEKAGKPEKPVAR